MSSLRHSILLLGGQLDAVATPIMDPTSGEIAFGSTVSITCSTSGSTIYYTTDGTDPDETDTEYTGPITVSSAMTIKAIGIADGCTDSEIASESYTICVEYQPIIFIVT